MPALLQYRRVEHENLGWMVRFGESPKPWSPVAVWLTPCETRHFSVAAKHAFPRRQAGSRCRSASPVNAAGLRLVDLVEIRHPAPAGLAPAERGIDHYRPNHNSYSPFFFFAAARPAGRAAAKRKIGERVARGGVSSCQSFAPPGQAQRGRD